MNNEEKRECSNKLGYTSNIAVPAMYQVVLVNDDFTPMEFVVEILEDIFFMDRRKAVEIMLEAHVNGKTVCGVFSKDVAESKLKLITKKVELHDHPLQCSMEVA